MQWLWLEDTAGARQAGRASLVAEGGRTILPPSPPTPLPIPRALFFAAPDAATQRCSDRKDGLWLWEATHLVRTPFSLACEKVEGTFNCSP